MTQFSASVALCGALSLSLVHCGGESKSKAESPSNVATVEAPPPAAEPPPTTAAAPAPTTEKPAEMKPAASEPPKPEPLSDEQIVMITDLANTAEVDQAKLAQTKAKDARVKKFAAMMISDHGGAKQKQAKLVTKLKLKPAESSPASELKSAGASTLDSLKAANAKDFDKTYIGSQVDEHKKVLDTLTARLIPSAKDAELKALLEEMRPTIEMHLKEAEGIQTALAAAPAAEEKPSTPAKTKGTTPATKPTP